MADRAALGQKKSRVDHIEGHHTQLALRVVIVATQRSVVAFDSKIGLHAVGRRQRRISGVDLNHRTEPCIGRIEFERLDPGHFEAEIEHSCRSQ